MAFAFAFTFALSTGGGDERMGLGTGNDAFGATLGVSRTRTLAYSALSPTFLVLAPRVLDLVLDLQGFGMMIGGRDSARYLGISSNGCLTPS